MGRLRIVAGDLRGRRIRVPDGLRVRPTADRVREALFDILGEAVAGARVLDAFAGSGALGFEAVSRGAASAVLVESDRAALEALRANRKALGLESRTVVLGGDVERLLGRGAVPGPLGLVLADPPYGGAYGGRLLRALARAGVLGAGARVVLERDRSDPAPGGEEEGFRRVRTATYGRTCLDFYVRPAGDGAGGP